MRIMTKEWVKNLEFHDLIVMLEPVSKKKIPFVFTNGGTEAVAKEDLYTVTTDFNVSDTENQLNFVMLPDSFDLEIDFLGDGRKINERTCRNDFMLQYLNRLRVLSYVPEHILKRVRDKRLLALGYADEETKKELLKFAKKKHNEALDLYHKCTQASIKAEQGLTIREQFKDRPYIFSLSFLFDNAEITKIKKVKDKIHLTLGERMPVVLIGARVIEEEADIVNSWVIHIELYREETCYELHLLIMKRDEQLISHYHHVTYAFQDLRFGDETEKPTVF
ncbi:MAG: DUF4085 domain-containing protein [Clostridia bacterium]|nr:DUF4085 domain-containing protein [Clostridia bacterium]